MLLARLLFAGSLVAFGIGFAFAYLMARRHPLKPFSRNLLLFILATEIAIVLLNIYTFFHPGLPYWNRFFTMHAEFGLGESVSTLHFAVVGVVGLIIALLTPKLPLWARLYWIFIFGLFVFLAYDELYSFHNSLGGRDLSREWRVIYIAAGIVLAGGSALVFWVCHRKSLYVFLLFFGGLALSGLAEIPMRDFIDQGFIAADPNTEWMYVFKEVGVMMGLTIALSGLLALMEQSVPEPRWSAAKRSFYALTGVGAACIVVAWMLPALEARFLSQPIDVQYEGGLELIGYQVSPTEIKPGDEVSVTLFWRAQQGLPEDYSLSVHLLGDPDLNSAAQSDELSVAPIPSRSWLPNLVMRSSVFVKTPRNLPVPASYGVMVRPWYGPWPLGRPWQDTTGVPVTDPGTAQQLSQDAVIVAYIPALPRQAPPASSSTTSYTFPSEGFMLADYSLPEDTITGRTLTATFQWQTTKAGTRDLSQFFHLVPVGGGETTAFDQQPFGGRFPTDDWPAALDVLDSWRVTLSDDLPAGEYDVFTGLYDVQTMERVAVLDSSGQPTSDNAIHLGTINYQPDPDSTPEPETNGVDPAQVCYAVGDTNTFTHSEIDLLAAMNRTTGAFTEIGETGSTHLEGMTFDPSGHTLYALDQLDVGQFGTLDLQTGLFTPIGSGLAPVDQPARNPTSGDDVLNEVITLSFNPATGDLWGGGHHRPSLFRIDPETGTVIRDFFGPGIDYLHVDLSHLTGANYTKIESIAIDPHDGTFYAIVGNTVVEDDVFYSLLVKLDFSTVDSEKGTIEAVPVMPLTHADTGELLRDVEGLSLATDGTLYVTAPPYSFFGANSDVLWRVDRTTGQATSIGQFSDYVDVVDWQALACSGQD